MHADRTHARSREGDNPSARVPLTLRLYPDSVLRSVCDPVVRFDSCLADLFQEMLALMRIHDGIGLAGPQAGLSRQLFVAEVDERPICLANPTVFPRGERDRAIEGCLSLPGLQIEIERAYRVEVHGYDAKGKKRKHRLKGLPARVVQHEVDHLHGVLICDHLSRMH